jgi:hypothetical protein
VRRGYVPPVMTITLPLRFGMSSVGLYVVFRGMLQPSLSE